MTAPAMPGLAIAQSLAESNAMRYFSQESHRRRSGHLPLVSGVRGEAALMEQREL
jgi:hypothetical protein